MARTKELTPKVLVIGGGPGGYVAAIRAGQLGLETVLVEKAALGGACLNRGCIPSKALIHAAGSYAQMRQRFEAPHMGLSLPSEPKLDFAQTIAWKDGVVGKLNGGVAALLKRAKVQVVTGTAQFTDAKTCQVETGYGPLQISAEAVILATGSAPVELASLPFGGDVLSSTEALALTEVPKHLVVVGGGYIGLELGMAFRKLGAQVTVVEAGPRILPQYDAELTEPVRRSLIRQGIALHLGAKAMGRAADGALLILDADGSEKSLAADKILVTVGRRPVTEGFGLETMGVAMTGPFIAVDSALRTSMRGVYAIGDVTGEPMLAHRASAQGEVAAEIIAGLKRRFEPIAMPAVCFTDPEIVSVGLSPTEAEAEGHPVLVGQFPFAASGRALSMDATEGFVRLTARRDDHRLLGVLAVGAHVSELSATFVTALEMGAVLEDLASMTFAHPTLSEGFHEAALKALGHAIHV